MKKKNYFILFLTLLVTIAIILNVVQYNKVKAEENAIEQYTQTYSNAYVELNSLTIKTFEDKVASGDSIYVYIGRPTCSDCSSFDKFFPQIVNKYKLNDTIYYVNVKEIKSDENLWNSFKEKYNIKYTPTLAKYSNKVLENKVEWTNEKGITQDEVENWIKSNGLE